MKKIIHLTTPIMLVVLCAVLFSFAPMPGAHNYQVFLDNKLVLEQYADYRKEAPSLPLDPQGDYKEISVRYNECGKTVSGRIISVKDDDGKLLKVWTFEGTAKGLENPMTVKVKDIIALKQKNSNILKLYYSSREFAQGQQVATIKFTKDNKTASR